MQYREIDIDRITKKFLVGKERRVVDFMLEKLLQTEKDLGNRIEEDVNLYLSRILTNFLSVKYEKLHLEFITQYLSDMINVADFNDPRLRFSAYKISADYITFYHGYLGLDGEKPRQILSSDDFIKKAMHFYKGAFNTGVLFKECEPVALTCKKLSKNLPGYVEVLRALRGNLQNEAS